MIFRTTFFDEYRKQFGKIRYQSVVDGINTVLDFIESDEHLAKISHISYVLATIYHETGWPWRKRFSPIHEGGRGKLPHQRKYGAPKPNGHRYYGRGYVQLTWDWNYKKMGKVLKKYYPELYGSYSDEWLYDDPELACDPLIAYQITTLGMRLGLFTGKALDDYNLPNGNYDYYRARKIINGMDRARKIADYAEKFEIILEKAMK